MIRSLLQFTLWSVLCGLIFPFLIWGSAKTFFGKEAKGSLISIDQKIIGSELLAQKFSSKGFFLPRPSVSNYDPSAGGASNLGPTSELLRKTVEERKAYWIQKGGSAQVPPELLYASASGLDPHLSLEAIAYQIPIVVKERGLNQEEMKKLETLISEFAENPQLGVFGSPKVNVLKLNLALDQLKPNGTRTGK
ncbi:K(+)-transporting ATPase subunit C [Leptospira perolatii]|uniref:Potassium-transporting ATPase KdpC subunit n=1 Tax=Leptospira perolatii TaxID=2023191 RepID=A0A2M9ZQ75_9LEPT|nr:K(+)-transporting ATPase subunit C [Leptospira perolatii]PJZ68307.1 K(+)-transporting ATPase subunit C [Leptospira perolatii]PJZ74226.1 K(+)-transporting ATPase subunit C [Leptospira perolatii]